jgi:hypothetical protein
MQEAALLLQPTKHQSRSAYNVIYLCIVAKPLKARCSSQELVKQAHLPAAILPADQRPMQAETAGAGEGAKVKHAHHVQK